MINFLYCIDSNYNIQASISIYSLLQNVSQKINIFIIHKDEIFLNNLSKKILNHKNLNLIECFQFNENNINFPNLSNNHISEATYYRLFLSNYLPEDIKSLVYLDADVVCIQDPIEKIKKVFSSINDSYSIAVRTEIRRNLGSSKLFDTLGMKNDVYFNAGVMAINLENWKIKGIEKISQERIYTMAEKLQFWDQDILNSIFDGDYFELDKNLNNLIDLSTNPDSISHAFKEKEDLPIFIHYAGSNKPWFFNGILSDDSQFYQQVYKSLFSYNYHLVTPWKKFLLLQLIDYIKNMKSYKVQHRSSLVYLAIKRLIVN